MPAYDERPTSYMESGSLSVDNIQSKALGPFLCSLSVPLLHHPLIPPGPTNTEGKIDIRHPQKAERSFPDMCGHTIPHLQKQSKYLLCQGFLVSTDNFSQRSYGPGKDQVRSNCVPTEGLGNLPTWQFVLKSVVV